MTIQTNSGNAYSYFCRTNKIEFGSMEEHVEWIFSPIQTFNSMPDLNMFVIGVTEQCNLRCTYCCYSGQYQNNRQHSTKGMSFSDIDEIYDFILKVTRCRPLRIAFYGGEPIFKFTLIQYAVEKGNILFPNQVKFSITTNATLLTPNKIDWLMENEIEMQISIDGTKEFHDRYRVHFNKQGSFDEMYNVLTYIKQGYKDSLDLVSLQMTLVSYGDLERIAKDWSENTLLNFFKLDTIHGLAPNFAKAVHKFNYKMVKDFYEHLLNVYEKHQDWNVFKTFFAERIDIWKNRPIVETNFMIPLSTCMPLNTKLYIDSNKEIGVCEKMADVFRIGDISNGINWSIANSFVLNYFNRRKKRCKHCFAIHMCSLCLTATEYTDEQWDLLCYNEQLYTKVFLWVFCEMAERGMIS